MTSEFIEKRPDILRGFVLDQHTKKPLLWVKVNVHLSDETSLTNDNGEFRVLSWKKLPVTINVEHAGYEPVLLRVTCVNESLIIMLRRNY